MLKPSFLLAIFSVTFLSASAWAQSASSTSEEEPRELGTIEAAFEKPRDYPFQLYLIFTPEDFAVKPPTKGQVVLVGKVPPLNAPTAQAPAPSPSPIP